ILEYQRCELLEHRVALSQRVRFGIWNRFDRKRAEPDRVMLADGVERVDGTQRPEKSFGNKQRIPRSLILPAPLAEVWEVDIGRQEINLRSARSPYVHQVRQRTGAWILPGQITWSYQRRVGVHRKGKLGLASLGDLVGVPREVPGHEDLVGP